MVNAMCLEIRKQKHYLSNKHIETLYFGGGTPSLLSASQWQILFDEIKSFFFWNQTIEITIEANPEDINEKNVALWLTLGINRFSVGVQSFFQQDLIWMNRYHNAEKSFESIVCLKKLGIQNINIDLIYGLPDMNHSKWQQNLVYFGELDIPHLSAYAITVEPQTALASKIKNKKTAPVSEETMIQHFQVLTDWMAQHDYEQYEISNFAKNKNYSKHNTSYWQGSPYLGIGPGAHSFNGISRQWNISNNIQYIRLLNGNKDNWFEKEILSPQNIFNERVMTQLRTQWGLSLLEIESQFGTNSLTQLLQDAQPYLDIKLLCLSNQKLLLSQAGKLLADKIISDLMQV